MGGCTAGGHKTSKCNGKSYNKYIFGKKLRQVRDKYIYGKKLKKVLWQIHLCQKTKASNTANTFLANMTSTFLWQNDVKYYGKTKASTFMTNMVSIYLSKAKASIMASKSHMKKKEDCL